MSIRSQINRISQAKSAIATAIAGKGVTVPNGTSIDGMAALVAEIPTGGGLPSGVSKLASGTVTLAEDNTSGEIVTHNLGVVPNFLAWFVEDDYSGSVATSAAIAGVTINKKTKYTATSTIVYNAHYMIIGYGSNSQQTATSGKAANNTYLTATQARIICNSSYPIKAGKCVRWVVGVADGEK